MWQANETHQFGLALLLCFLAFFKPDANTGTPVIARAGKLPDQRLLLPWIEASLFEAYGFFWKLHWF